MFLCCFSWVFYILSAYLSLSGQCYCLPYFIHRQILAGVAFAFSLLALFTTVLAAPQKAAAKTQQTKHLPINVGLQPGVSQYYPGSSQYYPGGYYPGGGYVNYPPAYGPIGGYYNPGGFNYGVYPPVNRPRPRPPAPVLTISLGGRPLLGGNGIRPPIVFG